MNFIVIVTFGSMTDDPNVELPEEINMEFDKSQSWDAIEYFTTCVKYFENAIKWDPNYHGVGANAVLWQGSRIVCRKLIRR